MPAVPQQQSSKAALIITVILLSMLSIGTIISTFYWNSEFKRVSADQDRLKQEYAKVVSHAELASEDIENLEQSREALKLPSDTPAIDVALEEIRNLTKVIEGAVTSYESAANDGQAVLNNVNNELKDPPFSVTTTADSLIKGMQNLSRVVQDQRHMADEAAAGRQDQTAKLADANAAHQTEIAGLQQQVVAVRAQMDANQQKYLADLAAKDQANDDQNKKCTDQINEYAENLAKMQVEIHRLNGVVDMKQRKIDQEASKLAQFRFNVTEPIVRISKGTIIRVASPNIVYIDLGAGDRMPLGLTFEVYDKDMGVPELGNGVSDEVLPKGKASIEVIRIEQNTSQCRVIYTKPGQTISEGDLLGNLIYDRHVKYNFFVYGDFDADLSGIWSPQKAEAIKNLIIRWGGNVMDHISADTDFVILGKEPTVPNFSKDELQQPLIHAQYDRAVEEQKTYDDYMAQARDLHIPVMNQNRLYYYTGFFDQAQR